MKSLIPIIAILLFIPALGATQDVGQSTYDKLAASAKCHVDSSSGFKICRYEIGKDFLLEMYPVGKPGVLVRFLKSNSDSEYFGLFDPYAGCAMVGPGKANRKPYLNRGMPDEVFISVRTGRVLKTVAECQSEK